MPTDTVHLVPTRPSQKENEKVVNSTDHEGIYFYTGKQARGIPQIIMSKVQRSAPVLVNMESWR